MGAGLWVGALVPMSLLLVRSLGPAADSNAAMVPLALERFSGIGPFVVALLLQSGIVNAGLLVPASHWQALYSTLYGRQLLVKVALFLAMLALAAVNRLRLAPALSAAGARSTQRFPPFRRLRAAVLAETLLALLVLGVVAEMGTLAPPAAGN